jgi:putative ABC transport system permease protein
VTPGLFAAVHPTFVAGRSFDEFHDSRREHVAVLGRSVASRFGISRLDAQPVVFVDGVALTVIGILDTVQRRSELLLSVIVPSNTARSLWGQPRPGASSMLVETLLGAAPTIARQAPVSLRPEAPTDFVAVAPAEARRLRDSVRTDLNSLFVVLAVISLIVSVFGIANTTLVSVLERVQEIGLRRAVGAQRRIVAVQFLAESAVLGTVGGAIGTSAGVVVVVATSAFRRMTPVVDLNLTVVGIVAGVLSGIIAGVYPSWRAANVEPADALRR